MDLRQEKVTLDQTLQMAEDSYEKSFHFKSVANVWGRWFEIKIYPIIDKRSKTVKFVVELENSEGENKVQFNLMRLIPLDLKEVLWIDDETLNRIQENILKDVAIIKQISNEKWINPDHYLPKIVAWYLINELWMNPEEIQKKVTEYVEQSVDNIIRSALLEDRELNEKVYDYNKIIADLTGEQKYLVLYNGKAKNIYSPETNEKILTFYSVAPSFLDIIRNNRELSVFLPENLDWLDEIQVLEQFKRNLPDKIELWKQKIKKDTLARIINNYFRFVEQFGDKPYLVFQTGEKPTEFVILVNNNEEIEGVKL